MYVTDGLCKYIHCYNENIAASILYSANNSNCCGNTDPFFSPREEYKCPLEVVSLAALVIASLPDIKHNDEEDLENDKVCPEAPRR